jgi:nucleoid DNA-binding protein
LIPKIFNKVITSDGIVLTDKVYPLEIKNHVPIPRSLKVLTKSVNYGLSSWIYIHPVPNNTNEAYVQNTSLINCGNVPDMQFNAEKGTIIFSVDVTDANGSKRTVIVPDKKTQKDVKIIMDAIFETIVNELKKGNDVCVRYFFTMKPKQSKERTYKSINTKELYTVPSKTKVKVSISKVLEGELNEK